MLKLTPKELEAVIAHELTHIINGDLKLTLLVNAIFMMQMKNLWKLWILPCTIINSKTSKIPPNLILLCVILFIFLAFPFLWLYSLYLFFILFLYILSLPFNITLHFLKKLI
ncbi:MAG: M48 family metalloprotease [Candidatus Peribacteria bacterium]|nr:M48 family metalloprotease [Candidatus Peribacteria bacterium]